MVQQAKPGYLPPGWTLEDVSRATGFYVGEKAPGEKPRRPMGRPRRLELNRLIMELANEGLGQKAIESELKRRGHRISHDTIARRLKELRA
jgi:hypothetical protein